MEKKKGNLEGAHTLLALTAILLAITSSCVAATLVKTNSSYHCNGGLGGCLIADDFELELIMDSHFTRILAEAGSQNPKIGRSGDPKSVPCDTGHGQRYNCAGGTHPERRCDPYKREGC